jgi:glutathione synthase/RimK-type ligase-like ATP-grasp enzyme
MILLCGIPSESPLAMVAEALSATGADYRVLNQRQVADCALFWQIDAGLVDGALRLGAETLRLANIRAAYVRLMDDQLLPELADEPEGSPARRHARAFHDAFYRWIEVAPGRIVNRSDPQGSNGSKPYQAQLIAQYGFSVPETLITNDPDAVLAFRQKHGAVIFKSMSGVRSIVRALAEDDFVRLEHIRWCPVQFQALVPGTDVRVHVIEEDVHATEIISDTLDYRYARRAGGAAELRAIQLSSDTQEKCVALTRGLGLAFAGIDLKVTPAGEIFCFEVNPSPAFSFYEANTGQSIASSLARYLVDSGTGA